MNPFTRLFFPTAALPLGLLCAALAPCSSLKAQDVTFGDVIWASSEPAPDVLPQPKRPLRVPYPEMMKESPDIGYVVVTRMIDEKGLSRRLQAVGSHLPFQRAVEADFSDWPAAAPAQRGGKAVDGVFWMAVIFNPKSAATTGPEATPRLLAPTPIYTSKRPTPPGESSVLPLTLSLDATGAVTAVKSAAKFTVTEENMAAIRAALSHWRFAPARKNAEPVAAELTLPVICEPKPEPATEQIKPARLIKPVNPVYPIAMRRYGLTGQVLLDFVVDVSGSTREVVIVNSDNPAFDEPAMTAVLQWKFEPGTKGGQPVNVHQRVPIVFQLNGQDSPSGSFRIEKMMDQSALPEAMRYDTPPVVRGVLVPVYPYALRRDGVKGKVKAAAMIDPRGRVVEVKVLSADKPELGRAYTAALEGFRFDPAMNKGKPVPHIVSFTQEFSSSELPDREADRLIALEKKSPDSIYPMSALDTPLKPISRRPPVFPVMASAATTNGEALVECIVDKDGRVRAPRVVSATEEPFGYAAVQSLSAWWFEKPLVDGKPAAVRVQVPFKFGPPAKTTKAAKDAKDADGFPVENAKK